jgi:hypothetical protein
MEDNLIVRFVREYMAECPDVLRVEFAQCRYGFFFTVDAFPFSGVAYLFRNATGEPPFILQVSFKPVDGIAMHFALLLSEIDWQALGVELAQIIDGKIAGELHRFNDRRGMEFVTRNESVQVSVLQPNGFNYLAPELRNFIRQRSQAMPEIMRVWMHIEPETTEIQEAGF